MKSEPKATAYRSLIILLRWLCDRPEQLSRRGRSPFARRTTVRFAQ